MEVSGVKYTIHKPKKWRSTIPSVTIFVCEICGQGFESPVAYQRHVTKHQVPLTEFFKRVNTNEET